MFIFFYIADISLYITLLGNEYEYMSSSFLTFVDMRYNRSSGNPTPQPSELHNPTTWSISTLNLPRC